MVTLAQAIILGIVQGITEFLPISSTGHLVLIPRLAHWNDPGLTFDAALHVGTLVALLLYFRQDWADIILSGVGRPQRKTGEARSPRWLLWGLLIASVPAGVFGLLWDKKFEAMLADPQLNKTMMLVVAGAMFTMAFVLHAADKFGSKRRSINQTGLADWLVIGFAQAIALIPGVSRSGITISAGLFRNLDRDSAARFAFLLSTPVFLGVAALKLKKIMHGGIPALERAPFAAGMITSAVVGYLVIAFLLSYVRRHNMNVFVVYRIILGLAILGLLASGVLH